VLIEDNKGDISLVKEAVKALNVPVNLSIIEDGQEGYDYFNQSNANLTKIDLVLLDLFLPNKNGKEILEKIRDNKNLNDLSVVILTSSTQETDILKTHDLNATCYLQKPVVAEKIKNIIESRGYSEVYYQPKQGT